MATATVTPDAAVSTRKKHAYTPEQKQASSLRRDAAMLLRLAEGSSNAELMREHAAQLNAKADGLYPAQAKAVRIPKAQCAYTFHEDGQTHQCGAKAAKDGIYCFGHTDPVTKLSESEWNAVEGYFIQDIRPRLLEGFTWRQLKQIANPVTT